jgi:dTDP-4-amino-4,6-dideoxygalactose transaminase
MGIGDRSTLRLSLTDSCVSTDIEYPVPFHQQGAYADLGCLAGSVQVTGRSAEHILSLVTFPELGGEQVQYTVDRMRALTAAMA